MTTELLKQAREALRIAKNNLTDPGGSIITATDRVINALAAIDAATRRAITRAAAALGDKL